MDTLVRRCALPGCAATIEQRADRPARLYCTQEHRRAARRMRAEHARTAPAPVRRIDAGPPRAPGVGDRTGPTAPGDVTAGAAPAPIDRTSAEINHDTLIRPTRAASSRVAAREARQRPELLVRIRGPLAAPARVAVLSLKGGVGKTTVAAGLGLALAECRGDRIAVLDSAPDPGTLADRLVTTGPGAGRRGLAGRARVESLGELLGYAGLAGRLTVIGDDRAESGTADGFRAEHLVRVDEHLSRFFDVTIADCGPGLRHGAVRAAVAAADVLVVVGGLAVDDASRASATLRWLVANGAAARARDAVVVLTTDRAAPDIPAERIRSHFHRRARAVLELPHDPHLASGGPIDVDRLRASTRERFLELAALVVEGLPGAGSAGTPAAGPGAGR